VLFFTFASALGAQGTGLSSSGDASPGVPPSTNLQATIDRLERRLAQIEARLASWDKAPTSPATAAPTASSGGSASVTVETAATPDSTAGGESVALDISAPADTAIQSRPARSAPNPYGVAARKLPDGQVLLVYGGGELVQFPNESEANAFIRRWHEQLAERKAAEAAASGGT
jgi:hypothetical protein